jgi:putative ABC transport system permease protein
VTTAASILIQTNGEGTPVTQAVRSEIRRLDAQLAVAPETMTMIIGREASRYGAVGASIAVLSALALLLCIVGIYGVTAHATAQRTREVGIRCALGAGPNAIFWLLFRDVRWPLLAGIAFGLPLAAFGATLVQHSHLLANVKPKDPYAFGGALIVLTCTAGAATFFPALRAARSNPSSALTND